MYLALVTIPSLMFYILVIQFKTSVTLPESSNSRGVVFTSAE